MDETVETLIIIDSLVSNGRLHAVDTALAMGLNVVFVCSAAKEYRQVELATYQAHPSFQLVAYGNYEQSEVFNKLDEITGETSRLAVSTIANQSSQRLARKLCEHFQLAHRKQDVLAVVLAGDSSYQFSKAYELYCPPLLPLKSALEQTITIRPVSIFFQLTKQGSHRTQRINSLL